MRVPAGRVIYKESLEKALLTLENMENCVLYGERILYVKCEKVELYGEFTGYVYVCLDVKKKADDVILICNKVYTFLLGLLPPERTVLPCKAESLAAVTPRTLTTKSRRNNCISLNAD